MDRDDLQKNVHILATMEETEMPVVSCYLNAEQGYPSCQAFLAERTILLKRIIPPEQRDSLDHSLERIESYVHESAYAHDVRGIAVFARTVENPFLMGLRFHVPLPNRLLVDRVPNIFHLVELKEIYDRYVVVLMTRKRAAILEINLGAVTRQTWSERPALPERVSREWTKEQYQRHRRKQTEEAIREKIKVVDGLLSASGHSHLILAGDAHMVERLKANLPPHLRQKLVDTVFAKANDKQSDIVEATLSSFIEFREQQSHTYEYQSMICRLTDMEASNACAMPGQMCSYWQKSMPPDQHGGVHVARRFKSVKANRMPVQNALRHSFEKLMPRRKC